MGATLIVVDTNIIAYFKIPGEFTSITESIFQKDADWIVPQLWISEFLNVLTMSIRSEIFDSNTAEKILQKTEKFLEKKTFSVSSSRILNLSTQSKCSSYDCEFVALAQDKNIPLVTFDKKIIREFPAIAIAGHKFIDNNT